MITISFHGFGGKRDDRKVLEIIHRADRADCFIAIHLRHHDVHQNRINPGRRLQQIDALLAILSVHNLHVVRLKRAGEGKDVAHIVIDDQHPAIGQNRITPVQLFDHLPLRLRQVRVDAVQEEGGLSQQSLGRIGFFDNHRSRHATQMHLFLPRQFFARVDDDWEFGMIVRLQLLDQLKARHVG